MEWYEKDWLSGWQKENWGKKSFGRGETKKRTIIYVYNAYMYVYVLCSEEVNGTWCCKFSMCINDRPSDFEWYWRRLQWRRRRRRWKRRNKPAHNRREQISVFVCACVFANQQHNKQTSEWFSESCHDSWLNCLRYYHHIVALSDICLSPKCVILATIFVSSFYLFLFFFDSGISFHLLPVRSILGIITF